MENESKQGLPQISASLQSGQTVDDKSQYLLDESMYQMKFHINNKSNERKN